jgi:acetyl-CoA synthetase
MSLVADSTTALDRVNELLADYSGPDACVATLLCDRHPYDAAAYTVVESDLTRRVVTYGELREESERFARLLGDLGVQPGDRVATLMGKTAEHLIAVVGTWRAGAVHVPLFTAFAPAAIAARLTGSGAKLVVCDDIQRPKLTPGDDMPAEASWRVVTTGTPADPRDLSFQRELAQHPPGLAAAAVGGDGPLIQLYTSGTTGTPKAVVVPVKALASFHAYMEFGLDVRGDDVLWNAADPGWGYGHYFGLTGSLCTGVPSVWLNSGFDAGLTWRVLAELGVTNFAAAPTVYRSLRAAALPRPEGLRLRCLSAAGEPLTPEISEWTRATVGLPVADHYGQTETGMLINNHHHPSVRRPLKPGSMGQAMPGWSGAVLHEERDEPVPPGVMGRIAFDLTASPLAWFAGYLDEPERSKEKFSDDGRWYLTGDAGCLDSDGYFRFQSRDDDVIIMAGYRIGPFDVESVLLSHPAVTEAAVIAAPDELRGEVLEAYVVLRDEQACTPELVTELQQLVKTKFAAHAYPRAIHAIDALPKTPSGKVQRYVLRQRRLATRDGS